MQEVLTKLYKYAQYLKYNKIKTYVPYTFQKVFHKAGSEYQYRFLMAGQQIGKCCTKSTVIETTDGKKKIGKIKSDFHVWAWDGEKKVKAVAKRPFKKEGLHECYRLVMSDGSWIECADHHRILTSSGWVLACDLLQESEPYLQESTSGISRTVHAANDRRSTGTPLGFLSDYQLSHRLCDEQLPSGASTVRAWFPSPSGVLLHSDFSWQKDVQDSKYTNSLLRIYDRLSIRDVALRVFGRLAGFLDGASRKLALPTKQKYQAILRLRTAVVSVLRSLVSVVPLVRDVSVSSKLASVISVDGRKIVSIYPIGRNSVYDFTVPGYYNYCTAGVVHHNSVSNLCETTFHVTGLYPDWWEGVRFTHPVDWWIGGQSTKKVRDNLQKKLLGDHEDPNSFGTGWIPKDHIGKYTRMAGMPGCLDSVKIRHVSGGWSTLTFKTYEQKVEEWMGETMHGISLDEEPPQNIWSQCVIRTLRNKGVVLITATPEQGITEVVRMFMNDRKPGTWYSHASMDDAPHYTKEDIEKALASIPAHERDMRRKGLPMFGKGLVFSVSDDTIRVDPFKLPDEWPRICGIDFGWDHPFVAVWGAWDKDTDTFYVYDVYRESNVTPVIHASAIKARGQWIPVSWPHDGLNTEKGSGTPLAQLYRQEGVNLLREKFSNPPAEGQIEGEGGNKIWPGLIAMNQSMQSGNFKVLSHLTEWFKEKNSYHVDENGKLVDRHDDIMAATRYCFQSRRFAELKPIEDVDRYKNRKKSNLSWRTA